MVTVIQVGRGLEIALLRASIRCLRGARSTCGKAARIPNTPVDVICSEAMLSSHSLWLFFYLKLIWTLFVINHLSFNFCHLMSCEFIIQKSYKKQEKKLERKEVNLSTPQWKNTPAQVRLVVKNLTQSNIEQNYFSRTLTRNCLQSTRHAWIKYAQVVQLPIKVLLVTPKNNLLL